MNYEENEPLVLTEDFGSEKKGNLIKKGTEVVFIKVVDNENDLANALVAFRYGKKILVTLESKIRPKNKKKIKDAHKEFNRNMMRHHPRTRRYHPNLILRYYFRVHYYFVDLFGGKNG
jgi:hypothetical protein